MEIGDNLADALLEQLSEVPEWMDRAACADTDLDPYYDDEVDDFKKLCKSCPVLENCRLKFATFHEETREIAYGVFHATNYGGDK